LVTRGWGEPKSVPWGTTEHLTTKSRTGYGRLAKMLPLRMNGKPGVSAHVHVHVTNGETHQLGPCLYEDAPEGGMGL